jgi:hypothetical protein
MTNQDSQLPWYQPGWFEQASAWIHAELNRQHISVGGPIEQPHVRPWSTVLRAPTSAGAIYFKASAPVLGHEPGLTAALARWRPDCMPQVLATDLEHGWMLQPDFGVSLRSIIQASGDLGHWHRVLPLYAAAQIELADRRDELLALGTIDRRLTTLPAQYARLLDDTDALRIDLPDGLTSEEYRRARAFAPQLAALCEQLAGYRIPETLHHDDFHDGNIFMRDGRYTLADWGESCVAHPFFTMVVTLRSIAYTLKLEEGAPELARLRDIYLEPWTRYETPDNLHAAFDLAQRVGMVCRTLTWYRVVSSLEEPLRSEYAEAVPGWLQEVLSAEATLS